MADTLDALPKAPGSKIIRKADEAAWRDGYKLLADAKQIYENERARGYAEGKEVGASEASRLVVETAAKVEHYMSTLDEQVAHLAMDIVRRVLGEFDQADLVAKAAVHALADFKDERALKLTVHPTAEQRVVQLLSRNGEREVTIQVETDPAVDEKTCLIASEFAVVEATVETQLAAISKALGLSEGRAVQ